MSKYLTWGVVFHGEWRWDYHGKKMNDFDTAKLVAFDLFDELHESRSQIQPYSQYRYLNSRIFGTSFYAFRNHFFFMSGYGQHTPVFKKEMTGDYLRHLHSIAFRVTKAECLDLPEITEEIRTIDLEPKALKLYD